MNIGNFEKVSEDNQPLAFKGRLEMPNISGVIYIVPNPNKYNDKSPDMIMKMPDRNGEFSQVGVAWRKELKNDAGDFYSITIDYPGFNLPPIYLSAFPEFVDDKDGGGISHYNVTWSRPRAKQNNAPVLQQQETHDQIPY